MSSDQPAQFLENPHSEWRLEPTLPKDMGRVLDFDILLYPKDKVSMPLFVEQMGVKLDEPSSLWKWEVPDTDFTVSTLKGNLIHLLAFAKIMPLVMKSEQYQPDKPIMIHYHMQYPYEPDGNVEAVIIYNPDENPERLLQIAVNPFEMKELREKARQGNYLEVLAELS